MKEKLVLTKDEEELIEAIRNLRKSYHNYSWRLELYVRELFELMLLTPADRTGY
jgi:hypothetical protein